MQKVLLSLASLYLLAFAAATPASVIVSIVPDTQTIGLGSPIEVAIRIAGLGNGTALGAYDLNVSFDTALLSFQSAQFGDPTLGDQLDLANLGLSSPLALPGTGTVNLIETSLDPTNLLTSQQAPDFILATLFFSSLGLGNTPVTLTLNSLADADGLALSATPQFGDVNVAAVPLPLSFLLMLSGLGVFPLAQKWPKIARTA